MIPYDRNKPFNQLPLLPPDENLFITLPVMKALNSANKALAELKGFARKLPNQSMLINTIALREAKASSEIENIFTTDDELYKSLNINEVALKGSAKEVLKYRQALWKGVAGLTDNNEITIDILIDLYREIKQVNDSIRPAGTETVIKKRGSGLLGGETVYTPPRGEELIKQKLNNLIEFINDDVKYEYDPLIKLALTHYQFEAIHPFRDGNGRAGRILCVLIAMQKQLLDAPILYPSAYIIRHKEDYYHLLNSVTARRSWERWIIFMLEAIEQTSIYTINKIEEIDSLFNRVLKITEEKLPNIRKEIVEKLFEQPYVSPKKLLDGNIKSLNTAKKYLQDLQRAGILVPEKIGKEIVYLNIDLYNLLSEI